MKGMAPIVGKRVKKPLAKGKGNQQTGGKKTKLNKINKKPLKDDPLRVFVRNLNYQCTKKDLTGLFNGVGKVQQVTMKKFKTSDGGLKASALVKFVKAGLAKKAITNLGGLEFQGNVLIVKQAKLSPTSNLQNPKTKQLISSKLRQGIPSKRVDLRQVLNKKTGIFSRLGLRANVTAGGGGVNAKNMKAKFGETYGLKIDFLTKIGINGPLMKTIRISNLPFNVTETEAGMLCSVGGFVQDINIITRNKHKVAFADMSHPLESVQVISMLNGQVYKNQALKVEMYYSNPDYIRPRGETGSYPMIFRIPNGLRSVGMGLGIKGAPISNLSMGLPSSTGPYMDVSPFTMSQEPPMLSMGTTGLFGTMGPMRESFPGLLPEPMSAFMDNRLSAPTPQPGTVVYEVEIRNLPFEYQWPQVRSICQRFADPMFAKLIRPGVCRVRFDRESDALRIYRNLDGHVIQGRDLQVILV